MQSSDCKWSHRPAEVWLQEQAVASGNWLQQDLPELKGSKPSWWLVASSWDRAWMLRRRAENSWWSMLLGKASKRRRKASDPGKLAPLNHINPGVTPQDAKKQTVQECCCGAICKSERRNYMPFTKILDRETVKQFWKRNSIQQLK